LDVLTSLLFTFSLLDSSRDGDLFLPSTGSDIKSEFSLEPEKLEIALSDVAELLIETLSSLCEYEPSVPRLNAMDGSGGPQEKVKFYIGQNKYDDNNNLPKNTHYLNQVNNKISRSAVTRPSSNSFYPRIERQTTSSSVGRTDGSYQIIVVIIFILTYVKFDLFLRSTGSIHSVQSCISTF
jgi:hypothetical protein